MPSLGPRKNWDSMLTQSEKEEEEKKKEVQKKREKYRGSTLTHLR